jgi:uncharacterized protein (TIGR02145 family)
MNSYYCVVSNAYGNVKSDMADVAAGCGAKTVSGGWLKFMCYNLGATTTADPFTFASAILGNFYQWGRNVANPRAANDVTNFTKSTAYPYDWKIPNGYGTLSNSIHQDDYLWRNHKTGTQDPCPAGWHVPSQSAFGAIFKGTADADIPGNATANTWSSTGTWVLDTGSGGYAVKPDGVTPTLFFPAAGNRYYNSGTLAQVASVGCFWSCESGATGGISLRFDRESVTPAHIERRAYGFSVRCVSE